MAEKTAVTGRAAQRPEKETERFLKITLVRSLIGYPRRQRETAKGLGLRRLNSHVVRRETPEILGMIRKIPHVLEVEAVEKP